MAERPRGKTGRTNDPGAMRDRVLDAAADLFQARGYNATTMQHITQAAGMTSGGLHHHFPTKKAIGLAVLRERVATAVDEAWQAPLARADSTAQGVAEVFGIIASDLDAAGRVQGCPLNNLALELSLSDPDFRGEIQRIFAGWRAAVADRLRTDQAAGRLPGVDPEAMATFVVSAYSGAMALAKAEQSTAPLKACGRLLLADLEG